MHNSAKGHQHRCTQYADVQYCAFRAIKEASGDRNTSQKRQEKGRGKKTDTYFVMNYPVE